MLVNKDFLTWLLIGWQLCCQPIRCQVWKSLLINMDFDIEITGNNSGPRHVVKLITDVCGQAYATRIYIMQIACTFKLYFLCRQILRNSVNYQYITKKCIYQLYNTYLLEIIYFSSWNQQTSHIHQLGASWQNKFTVKVIVTNPCMFQPCNLRIYQFIAHGIT